MEVPIVSGGPPEMPNDAVGAVVHVVGDHVASLLWQACYWCGFASCALLFVVAMSLIQFARRPRP